MSNTRKASGSPSATRPMKVCNDLVEMHIAYLVRMVDRCAHNDDHGGLKQACTALKSFVRLHRVLASFSVEESRPRYLVDVPFLRLALDAVTRTEREGLTYVTGPQDGTGSFALTRLVEIDLARASIAYASPDPSSQLDALEQLTDQGLLLLAMFHSHPGSGQDATHPSEVDLSTQAQLEEAGYPTIGAIFSRDGYVRFYTEDRPFEIIVSGTGCEHVTDRVYRITKPAGSPEGGSSG